MTLEQVNAAMVEGKTVIHTHMGLSAEYRLSGIITRYSPEKGWCYSLELRDLKADCVVIAALDDCEVCENGRNQGG